MFIVPGRTELTLLNVSFIYSAVGSRGECEQAVADVYSLM